MPRISHYFLLLTALFSVTFAIHDLHYIATFTSYQLLPLQEALLRSALALTPRSSWHILPRLNHAATTLPTDFILFETSDPAIIRELRTASFIRSVSSQGEHGRKLRALVRNQTADFEVSDNLDPISRQAGERIIPGVHAFGAGEVWRLGYTGDGVKVAVFDTGLIPDDTNFVNVAERTDWTGENSTADVVGHGTFVAGLIAGSHPACPGIAPHAILYAFRVFTGAQISYTSWFLDAFNYALHVGIDVLNLSIGGPDFADSPFTDKVNELSAHGVVIVSAIGNDGPLWGSLNNPGDMMEVVGVGGAEPDGSIAKFSSRGMTTHELDGVHVSYGRVKPDIVAYGRSLVGPSHKNPLACRKLSGTSVASPVVAGAIALLASTVPMERRRRVINPASVKRALIEGSHTLRGTSIYEQGAGLFDINDAYLVIKKIDSEVASASKRLAKHDVRVRSRLHPQRLAESLLPSDHQIEGPSGVQDTVPGPQAAFFPSFYDLTPAGCPHMWPHCEQPLFQGAMPINLNVTVLNPGGVRGTIENITWTNGQNGHFLHVEVTPPRRFWPWAAGMGVHISAQNFSHQPMKGLTAEGVLRVRVVSVHKGTHSDIELPIKAYIIATPEREKRLLWDMFHSVRYPPGYVPRDNLSENKDMLDWLGDHPHTNFHKLFRAFRENGFYVDILESPLTCLSHGQLKQYGGLLILDSEDYFSPSEIRVLVKSVKSQGLALIVAAEWHNVDLMRDIRFEDDNTRSWWSPIVAGANVPALNDVLTFFGISFGDAVLSGDVRMRNVSFRFESGVAIVRFPQGGELLYIENVKIHGRKRFKRDSLFPSEQVPPMPVFGLAKSGKGAVLTFGDTNCIDTAYTGARCYDFFANAVKHSIENCVGLKKCERMLQESRVLKEGLLPLPSGLGRQAKPPPSGWTALFEPHSRSNGMRSPGAEGSPEEALCSMRDKHKMPVAVNNSRLTAIHFPIQKRAEPLGSDMMYFRSFKRDWQHDSRSARSTNFFNQLENSLFSRPFPSSHARTRASVLMLLGVGLIALSFAVRRCKSSPRRLWRLTRRQLSRRHSLPSGKPMISTGELPSSCKTLSSILSTTSSCGSHGWRPDRRSSDNS